MCDGRGRAPSFLVIQGGCATLFIIYPGTRKNYKKRVPHGAPETPCSGRRHGPPTTGKALTYERVPVRHDLTEKPSHWKRQLRLHGMRSPDRTWSSRYAAPSCYHAVNPHKTAGSPGPRCLAALPALACACGQASAVRSARLEEDKSRYPLPHGKGISTAGILAEYTPTTTRTLHALPSIPLCHGGT